MIGFALKMTDDTAYQTIMRLRGDTTRINKLVLGRLGEKIVSHSQKAYLRGRPGLNRQAGTLANSLHYNWLRSDTIEIGPGVKYGAVHEGYAYGRKWEGAVEIRPTTAKALHFKVGGKEVFAKMVRIPVRPWLYPAIKEYFDQGHAERLVDRTLQQELDLLQGGR